MHLTLPLTLALLSLLSACSTAANQSTIKKTGLPDEFFNTEWQLNQSALTEEIPMLIFGLEENRIFGSGGCNRFSGAYLAGDKGTLGFGDVVATRMACNNQTSETEFFSRLNNVALYKFNDDFTELSLLNTDGDVLLAFKMTRLKRI